MVVTASKKLKAGPAHRAQGAVDAGKASPVFAPLFEAAETLGETLVKGLTDTAVANAPRDVEQALNNGLFAVPTRGSVEYLPSLAALMRAMNLMLVAHGAKLIAGAEKDVADEWKFVTSNLTATKLKAAKQAADAEHALIKKIKAQNRKPKYEICLRVTNEVGMRLVYVRAHDNVDGTHTHPKYKPWKP